MLKNIVHEAISNGKDDIYRKITLNVNENAFYSQMVEHLKIALKKRRLSMYMVDTNYNRAVSNQCGKGVGVYDKDKKTVLTLENNQFDLIVHMNGRGNINYPENLIHIEVKKYNNLSDREKDKKRLISTTMFPDKFSTYCLGLIVNTDIFESFYNVYKTEQLFLERSKQIEEHIEEIKASNKEIFNQYLIDYSKTDIWFSNIIAGYQLGAFIDIYPNKVDITYFYSGSKWCQETISL